ncbi:uncharacterized protein LOC119466658 isoform X1 [Dermacentor silvarum]|uniref:uncharacterized protein LOC119466658 isoform X1 n=1 Tax=Dermacentor silvarum TaxID=543639 RepID=UPI002100B2B4|nr:uncharacterized protein LOC119466658 isoform X1 [Dermacentor silvarum]
MSSAAEGTSRSHVSAASGRQAPGPGDAPVDERTVGLVKLFMSTLLPDFSPRGAVYAVALVLAVCYAGIVLAGVIRKAPSSPFRCDDPSLQAAQEKDVLPTAPYVALVFASSVTVVFVNEFRRASASWTEATYWTARHLRRFFVGFVVTGDIAHTVQLAVNAKRPYFIDACQPAVKLPNGTEVLVCSGIPVAPESQSGVHRRSESELSPGDGDEEPYSEGNGDANDRAITALAENSNVTNAPRSPAVWTVQQPGGAPRPSPEGHVGDSYIAFGTNGASGAGGDARYYYRHVDLISDWVPPTGDVTDYRCTGPKGRKSGASFPSGHATVAAFAGVFMLGYGIRRFANFHQPFRAAFLAWALGTCVWLVCAQRVVQHKHFLIDVVCGSAFGSAVAAAFVLWPYEDDKDRHANAGR